MPALTAIKFNGQMYYWTGKLGSNIKMGIDVAEYEMSNAVRIWVSLDGSCVFPE